MHKSHASPYASLLSMKLLPKVGYIAYLGDQPIAAGFLRRLEPCYAQLDTLVSSPYFGSQIRHKAITDIVDRLIADAKDLKLEGLIAFTVDGGVLQRAHALGCHILPDTLVGLPLSKKE